MTDTDRTRIVKALNLSGRRWSDQGTWLELFLRDTDKLCVKFWFDVVGNLTEIQVGKP